MRKLINIFLIFFIPFLSGCDKKQILTCQNIIDEEGLKTVQVYQMTYEGKKIKEAQISTAFKPEDTSYYDTYAGLMDEAFNNIKETEGIIIKTSSNKPVYDVDITIDFNKVTKDTKIEQLNLDMSQANFYDSIDKLKEDMETDGLTCNIK